MTNGKSNINERLQEIEKRKNENPHVMYGQIIYAGSGRMQFEQTDSATDDVKWMHDTIKQLQEDVRIKQELLDEYRRSNKEYIAALDTHSERIAELEKERREITAAHEAYMWEWKSLNLKFYYKEEMESFYNKHFQFIHLAEQVRLAKLSADAE